MTNYREILRLDSIGLNRTEIATSRGCSRNTVAGALKRAAECGLIWPLPADMSDQQLAGILYPSVAGKPEYKMPDYEWGLSIMIDADHRRILLDTGASGQFAQNAECLDIDLNSVEIGVLSHAHYDHSDGLDSFFSLNNYAPFLMREGTCENCFGIKDGMLHYIGIQSGILKKHQERIQYVSGVHEIADGIWLVPHRRVDYSAIALRNDLYTVHCGERRPDDFNHEQSLVIETKHGLVVFNSCAHAGMANILWDIHDMLGRRDACAYVGGLHLYKMTDGELDALCEEIRHSLLCRQWRDSQVDFRFLAYNASRRGMSQ